MSGTNPTRTGSAIYVADATALAALDASNLNPGTRVRREDTVTDWVLTVVGSGGVAVAGFTGLRWIEDTGGGGGGSVDSVTATTATGINNTDPTNPIILDATAGHPGLMSAANFSKVAALTVPTVYDASLGAPGSELTCTGMAGNTDKAYRIDFYVNIVANGKCCFIPNNSESNLKACAADFIAGQTNVTNWRCAVATAGEKVFANGDKLSGFAYFYASTAGGGYRRFSATVFADQATDDVYYISGVLTETATEITQFSIQPAAANAFGAGSWMKITSLG